MSHRVKNLLAIATSLTRITSRSSSSIEDMTKQLMNRLTALDRAHDLVRPLPGDEGKSALLGDIFTVLLAPYDDEDEFAGRIRVAVPRMGVGHATATALALIVHELATNSVKYGSLSAEGYIDVFRLRTPGTTLAKIRRARKRAGRKIESPPAYERPSADHHSVAPGPIEGQLRGSVRLRNGSIGRAQYYHADHSRARLQNRRSSTAILTVNDYVRISPRSGKSLQNGAGGTRIKWQASAMRLCPDSPSIGIDLTRPKKKRPPRAAASPQARPWQAA